MSLGSAPTGSAHASLAHSPLCVDTAQPFTLSSDIRIRMRNRVVSDFCEFSYANRKKRHNPDPPTWTRIKISIFDARFYRLSSPQRALLSSPAKPDPFRCRLPPLPSLPHCRSSDFTSHATCLPCLRCSTSIKPL